MLKNIVLYICFLLFISTATAQHFGQKEHKALLALQQLVNEFTLHINAVALQQTRLDIAPFEEKLKTISFPPFIVALKPSTEVLIAHAKIWDIQKIHAQQDALAEDIYLAYLKANEEKSLENQYHHAEAEMTHALAEAQRRWHLCDSKRLAQDTEAAIIPISQLPSAQRFWEAWKQYKDKIITYSSKERLEFYNQNLVKLFNDFIDAVGKEGEYMPYQICLVLCLQEEASAEGK